MKMKNVEDIYPLSPLQQGMLFHTLYAPQSGIYSEQVRIVFSTSLDVAAFKMAWQRVIERHTILRTAFVWEGLDEPLQVVRQYVALPWEEQDLRALPEAEQMNHIKALLKKDSARGFELSQAPLMRLTLLHLSPNMYHFVWNYHHLLLDGWSLALIIDEISSLYAASRQGQFPMLQRPRPYRDYIAWLQGQDLHAAETFWRQYLAGFTFPTPLMIEKADDEHMLSVTDDDFEEQELHFSPDISAALQVFARRHQLTLNVLICGVWALLLSRYSGETDVVFGTTVSTRPAVLTGVETMMGLLINTLPSRIHIPSHAKVLPWLKQLQKEQIDAHHYDYTPLMQLQQWSEVPPGQPLFKSLLVVENYPLQVARDATEDGASQMRMLWGAERTNYPLTITVVPGTEMLLRAGYQRTQFDQETIARLLGHAQVLLEGMISQPEQIVSRLPLLSKEEYRVQVVDWNTIHQVHHHLQCLHHLFEEQALLTPDAVATIFEDHRLTYRELNARANQVAHYLEKLGVGPEVIVSVFLERSLELVVCLLGILKAGGAYLPLDPGSPQERLDFMLTDAQSSILLTERALLTNAPKQVAHLICLDTEWKNISQEHGENVTSNVTVKNMAYVIYTSGSTGIPKGVQVAHDNVVRLLKVTEHLFHFESRDIWTLFHAVAFDFSVWELWGALLYGGQLVIVPYLISRSSGDFLSLLCEQGVTILNQTPSAFKQLIQLEKSKHSHTSTVMRLIIFGGEMLERCSLRAWFERYGYHNPQCINMYGITETTVHVTYGPVQEDEKVSIKGSIIGKPLKDLQVYILDQFMQPVPIGVAGELYIGGAGLTRGYLNRPELTAERFLPHPFSKEAGARLYRTGDLGRFHLSGEIEYLGRNDHQVKIRGFRIELGEIAAVLARHPAIQEAIVVIHEQMKGDKQLIAYVVLEQSETTSVTSSQLRTYLKELLPTYMLPSTFIMLESLPLTANGKVDRRALPSPDQFKSEASATFVAPRNSVEGELVRIWCDVLHVKHIGVYENFFELGGHSLFATQVISHIREAFQVELPLRTLFEAPTIAQLAEAIILKEIEEADRDTIATMLAQRE